MQTTALTAELTDEYGHLVPPTLIECTVQTAVDASGVTTPDAGEVLRAARADVEALAEAVRRRTDGDAPR